MLGIEQVHNDGELLSFSIQRLVRGRSLHELQLPDERSVGRVTRLIDRAFGAAAAAVVERGADFLREEVMTRPAPRLALAHGDWVPKDRLIDNGAIVGVIDQEFAGPASPAFVAMSSASFRIACTPSVWQVRAGPAHPLV